MGCVTAQRALPGLEVGRLDDVICCVLASHAAMGWHPAHAEANGRRSLTDRYLQSVSSGCGCQKINNYEVVTRVLDSRKKPAKNDIAASGSALLLFIYTEIGTESPVS